MVNGAQTLDRQQIESERSDISSQIKQLSQERGIATTEALRTGGRNTASQVSAEFQGRINALIERRTALGRVLSQIGPGQAVSREAAESFVSESVESGLRESERSRRQARGSEFRKIQTLEQQLRSGEFTIEEEAEFTGKLSELRRRRGEGAEFLSFIEEGAERSTALREQRLAQQEFEAFQASPEGQILQQRQQDIFSREQAFRQLGLPTPGESKREVLGFLQQRSLPPEQGQLQLDGFGGFIDGEKFLAGDVTFFDPETGFTGEVIKSERELVKEKTFQTVEPVEEKTIFERGIGVISTGFEGAQIRTKEVFVDPISSLAQQTIGETIGFKGFEEFGIETKETASIIRGEGDSIFRRGAARTFEFVGGVGKGGLQFFQEKPLVATGLVGVGFAGGFAFAGLSSGAIATGTALGGVTGGTIAQVGLTGGLLALGGREVIKIGGELIAAPGAFEAGEIFGLRGTQLALIGTGAIAGQKGFAQVKGLIRTRGLEEIPLEDVLAPEFAKGQTFPQIRKGQTAGQLRQEFLEPVLPGEIAGVPKGFTARAIELQDIIPPSKGKPGELVGLFQSPRVSPRFLRVGGEKVKVFSLDLPSTATPTIIRLQPSSLGFAPGVTATTRVIKPLSFNVKAFSKSIAGTGKSIIPFVKSEKEAVVALETPIKLIQTKFFVKFEGIRVPIKEFITLPTGKGSLGITTPTLGKVALESSFGRLPISSIVTPSSIAVSSLVSSIPISSPVSSLPSSRFFSEISRSFKPSVSASSIFSRGRVSLSRSISSSVSAISSSISGISRPSGISGISGVSRGSRLIISKIGIIEPITTITPPQREPKKKKVKKKEKKKKRKTPIRPSLTGITRFQFGGITGPLPKETPGFGILPSRIRFVPKGL